MPDLVGLRHGEGDVRAACGDFLDKQGDKPAYIEYQGCHAEYEGQGKPLVARYRLDGTHAAEAEDFCAGATASSLCALCAAAGESTPHSWVDDGHAWNLVFASEETLLSARAQWSRIPTFHIRGAVHRGALTRRYFTATESASENRNISVYSGSFQ